VYLIARVAPQFGFPLRPWAVIEMTAPADDRGGWKADICTRLLHTLSGCFSTGDGFVQKS
jgi:hypothetical protein